MYEIETGTEWADGRSGPQLDEFDDILKKLDVNQFFRIALKQNAKGKLVPERGFNVKAANSLYEPKVFKKARVEPKGTVGAENYKPGYVKVQRVK